MLIFLHPLKRTHYSLAICCGGIYRHFALHPQDADVNVNEGVNNREPTLKLLPN